MHHTDEDDAFASSTMAAEGSQPEATLAATTSQPELSSDEAARAQCLRCKTNGSQSGKHTCGKRRSTSPAATAAKRARPKRNSTDPPEEHVVVDRIWSPASTNVNERLSVAEARMADFSPMAMPNMPAQDSECEAPSAMEHEQLELGSYKIGEGLAQPSSVSDSSQHNVPCFVCRVNVNIERIRIEPNLIPLISCYAAFSGCRGHKTRSTTQAAPSTVPLSPSALSLVSLTLIFLSLGLADRVARVAMNDPTADSNCLCACAAARTRVRIPVASRPSGVLHDQAVSFSFTGCPPRLSPPRLPSAASAPPCRGRAKAPTAGPSAGPD